MKRRPIHLLFGAAVRAATRELGANLARSREVPGGTGPVRPGQGDAVRASATR